MAHMSKNKVKAYGGELCHWCKDPLLPTGTLLPDGQSHPKAGTRDHLIPKAHGGGNSKENLVLACYVCNYERGDLDADVWMSIISERRSKKG